MKPPPEVVELGQPDRIYRGQQQVTSGMVVATYVMGTLALLVGGGLLVAKDVFGIIPPQAGTMVYVLCAVFIGGAVLMFVGLSLMASNKPKYLYAFYPVGLVIHQKGQWGLVPWVSVTLFDERTDPALVLENNAVIPIVHDFPNGFDLIGDIRQYVLAKDGLLGKLAAKDVVEETSGRGILHLLAGAALLIGVGVTTFLTWDWMVEMNQPAQAISHDELVQLQDPSTISRGWVSLDVPQVIKTDVEMEQQRFGVFGTTESKFVLIPIKDSYLIAQVKNDFKSGKEIKGVVAVWRGDAGRYSKEKLKAVDAIVDAFPKYKARFLPFQFDATVPLETNAKALPLGLALAGIFGLGFLLRGWSQRRKRVPRVVV
jgi:hypothetical protein